MTDATASMPDNGAIPGVVVDPRFDRHFSDLMQVFFYITDECNLRCAQCYYKPWLRRRDAELSTPVLLALLAQFRRNGARKLSFLGGEPTLYGRRSDNATLPELVAAARALGFEYVRVVTNGLLPRSMLDDSRLRDVDDLTFSLDGDTAEVHDALRGRGTFGRSVRSVERAVDLGYRVQITTCVHRGNVGSDDKGRPLLDRAVNWAHGLGASRFNLHPLFKMGIPRDGWTGETDITPTEWVAVYRHMRTMADRGGYPIPVRIPERFVASEKFQREARYYGFCPVKLAERIEVHPNGQIHSCALNNGTPICLARFEERDGGVAIDWEETTNELEAYPFDLKQDHPCAAFSKEVESGLVPLCISFKPLQDEFAWKEHAVDFDRPASPT